MNLASIVMAKEAFVHLSKLRMKPTTSYRVLKYLRAVLAEAEVIEQHRVKLLHEVTGTKENENVKLDAGTAAHSTFVQEYSKLLELESDLKPSDISLMGLLEELTLALQTEPPLEKKNFLTPAETGLLEPFFGA